MKRIIILLFMGCLLMQSAPLKAQEPGMDPARQEEMKKKAAELKAKLKLSEPQSAKYDEITKRHRDEARRQIQNLPPDALPSERREIMKKELTAADEEIFEILDSEQQAIYKAEKEKMKQEMAEKKKARKKEKK